MFFRQFVFAADNLLSFSAAVTLCNGLGFDWNSRDKVTMHEYVFMKLEAIDHDLSGNRW